MTETLMLTVALVAMVAGLLLTFVPIIPGAVLVWGVGMITAVSDGFERVTVGAAIAMTVVMIIGETREFWLPVFGVKMGGLTCLTSLGALFGGLIGAFVIPLPIVNALAGTVAGAVIVEVIVARRAGRPLRLLPTSRTAAALFAVGYALEIVTAFLIVGIFVVSILTTQ